MSEVRKQGIAIILVLGLLSLLMLLAVAFSVSMRVERTAAGGYSRSVYAKNLIDAALAEAVADINTKMGSSSYPQWDVFTSGSGGDSVNPALGVDLGYIPDTLTNMIVSGTNAYWVNLQDPNKSIVGRCAYIVVNTSGFLDANKAGGTNRMSGTNAAEIQLDNLPDMANVKNFLADRSGDGRYESALELRSLNSGMNVKQDHSFVTYSMAPEQTYASTVVALGTVTNKAYVGDPAVNPWNATDIVRALADSGISDPTAQATAYSNLLDYVDADSLPQGGDAGLGYPSAEAVPMFNEAALDYTVTLTTNAASFSYTVRCRLRVETFYPFDVACGAGNLSISYSAQFTPFTFGVSNIPNTCVELLPADITDTKTFASRGWNGKDAYTFFPFTAPVLNGSANPNTNPITVAFLANVKAKITDASGNTVFDCVPYPYSDTGALIQVAFQMDTNAFVGGTATVTTQEWVECLDPKFNWSPRVGSQWYKSATLRAQGIPNQASSIGGDNRFLMYALAADPATSKYSKINFDGTNIVTATPNYVANRPLKTVGELGYIPIGPWTTIRLFDHRYDRRSAGWKYSATDPPYHNVLDCFTVYPPAVSYRRGLVNINVNTNSPDKNILASAFINVPEKEYITNGAAASWASAGNMAQQVIDDGPYATVAGIGAVSNWSDFVNSGAPASDIVRESPIRNSAGLLTARQNLFTIYLAASTVSHELGLVADQTKSMGSEISYEKAMAVVWRDPVPDQNSNHWWFVRQLIPLNQ